MEFFNEFAAEWPLLTPYLIIGCFVSAVFGLLYLVGPPSIKNTLDRYSAAGAGVFLSKLGLGVDEDEILRSIEEEGERQNSSSSYTFAAAIANILFWPLTLLVFYLGWEASKREP